MRVGVHAVAASTGVEVLDEAQTQRTSAVLVTLEFLDRSVGGVGTVEANDARATRATAGLILNLGLLYLTNSREELDEILIAGRPGKLMENRQVRKTVYWVVVHGEGVTHVADINDL